jgi:hypothetical protein
MATEGSSVILEVLLVALCIDEVCHICFDKMV